MCAKLNGSLVVHRLAADLGLRPSANPVQTLLQYCYRKIGSFLQQYGSCSTVAELLDLLANKLGTRMVEINDDRELADLQLHYSQRGEALFATLDKELSRSEDYGITIKLKNPKPWEQPYISIVDCRGRKRQRRYHTKWHEIGHLLILTDQTRFAFYRSHDSALPKSAEESLVDAIAGDLSFYPEIIAPHLAGPVSFERIEELRARLCPEASTYSAILNLSKLWPTPCVWLEAQLAAKKVGEAAQETFSFLDPPERTLRAVYTSANPAAREIGLGIIPRFRVPKDSIIARVFENGWESGEGHEDLSSWESSEGTRLNACAVHVRVKRLGQSIHALVVPSLRERSN